MLVEYRMWGAGLSVDGMHVPEFAEFRITHPEKRPYGFLEIRLRTWISNSIKIRFEDSTSTGPVIATSAGRYVVCVRFAPTQELKWEPLDSGLPRVFEQCELGVRGKLENFPGITMFGAAARVEFTSPYSGMPISYVTIRSDDQDFEKCYAFAIGDEIYRAIPGSERGNEVDMHLAYKPPETASC